MSANQISKAQERETLEQIMELVQKIGGDDSYVGMAMKGVYEVAVSNIENDCADSLAAHVRSARNNAEKHKNECEALKAEVKAYEAEAVEAMQLQKEAQQAVAVLQREVHKLREESVADIHARQAAQIKSGTLELELRSAKQEVMNSRRSSTIS